MTYQEMVRAGAERLRAADLPDPFTDARRLLSGLADGSLAAMGRDEVPAQIASDYDARITECAAHRPVSHILGWREFWGRRFLVNEAVLDPRPETETLVAAALDAGPFDTVLDLGTGSGAILLTLLAERPSAHGLGTDISVEALAVARQNQDALKIERAHFLHSDWLTQVTGQFDLVVSNPPYIAADEMAGLSRRVHEHEPHLALTPGGDGLAPYRIIARNISPHLKPGTRILLEIGPTQGEAVCALFAPLGRVDILPDLDGRDRVVRILRD